MNQRYFDNQGCMYEYTALLCFKISHLYSVSDLLRLKDELSRERDDLLNDVIKLREQLKAAQDKHDQFEKEIQSNETKINEAFYNFCLYMTRLCTVLL